MVSRSRQSKLKDLLDLWARWRNSQGSLQNIFWHRQTLLGRILGGIKSSICTRCHGVGRVAVPGYRDRPVCPICGGDGRVKLDDEGKINPAMIPATARGHDDPVMFKLEHVFDRGLTKLERLVVEQEYFKGGTRMGKASRLGISVPAYSKRLSRAHERFQAALQD